MARINPENSYLSSLVAEAQASRELHEVGARLVWLHQADLGWDSVAGVDPHQVTAASYDLFANEYSSKEWGLDLVDVVWSEVFNRYFDFLQNLTLIDGQRSKVLLSGVGTGRDPIIVALLNKSLDVVAYDKSLKMLDRARHRLTWEDVSTVILSIGQVESDQTGWFSEINGLMDLIKSYSNGLSHLEEKIIEIFSDFESIKIDSMVETLSEVTSLISLAQTELSNKIIDDVYDRLKFEFADHIGITYQTGSFHAIFDKTLQHLDKMTGELDEAIARKLDLLAVGGQYHFSLRLDPGPLRINDEGQITADGDITLGRVFSDNSLNPASTSPKDGPGWRYYSSVSTQEVQYLVRKIEAGTLNRLTSNPHQDQETGLTQTPRPKFKVVEVWESSTLTYHKPSFINFRVVRVA